MGQAGEMDAGIAGGVVPAAPHVQTSLTEVEHAGLASPEGKVPLSGLEFAGGALGLEVVAHSGDHAELQQVFPNVKGEGAKGFAVSGNLDVVLAGLPHLVKAEGVVVAGFPAVYGSLLHSGSGADSRAVGHPDYLELPQGHGALRLEHR